METQVDTTQRKKNQTINKNQEKSHGKRTHDYEMITKKT
jgi:hypothetical protein